MAEPKRKISSPPETVKEDAKGAMAPSQADPTNDGADSADPTGDATQPPHDHSSPRTPKTERENPGEE